VCLNGDSAVFGFRRLKIFASGFDQGGVRGRSNRVTCFVVVILSAYLRRRKANSEATPKPANAKVEGSGTGRRTTDGI
jgi:hypothetical protein